MAKISDRSDYHNWPMLKEIECDSARELLEYLNPENEIWMGNKRAWGFRGHRNAAWKLTPHAFRVDWSAYFENIKGIPIQQLEEKIFIQFARRADRVGLRVPGIEFITPEDRLDRPSDPEDIWPHKSIWEGLALAQHHQIPTRLLDFSESAYVAAYFAAVGELDKCHSPETDLAVWAVNLDFVRATNQYQSRSGIFRIDPPRAGNPYMLAQRVFFLLDMDIGWHPMEGDANLRHLDYALAQCGKNRVVAK